MAGPATTTKVLHGLYAGWTRERLLEQLARHDAQLESAGTTLQGATLNSQDMKFGPRKDMNLHEWKRSLLFALSQVDPDYIAPASSIGARFGRAD